MRIRDFLLKITGVLLCMAMAAVLVALFFMNRTRNHDRAEELKKQAEELKRQEEQRREDAADLYEDLVSDLMVRNIVCWGDNEMAGNGDASLPGSLKQVANEKLFTDTVNDFSGAMDKEAEPALSVTVNNMGVRNEGMREILVRAGVNELQLAQWTVISSDTDPHNIELKDNISWSTLRFANQDGVRFGSVDIDGIYGTLTVGDGEYDDDHPRFAFVRDEEGDSMSFGAGTQVEIASATDYIGDIPVFFFEDDSADSVSGFVNDLESLVERYTEYDEAEDEDAAAKNNTAEGNPTEGIPAEDNPAEGISAEDNPAEGISAEGSALTEAAPEAATTGAADNSIAKETEPSITRAFVVICTAEEGSDLDEALREAFGDRYIRNDTYAYEMSEDSYRKLAERVFDNLEEQGCFDDVKRQTESAVEQLKNL